MRPQIQTRLASSNTIGVELFYGVFRENEFVRETFEEECVPPVMIATVLATNVRGTGSV